MNCNCIETTNAKLVELHGVKLDDSLLSMTWPECEMRLALPTQRVDGKRTRKGNPPLFCAYCPICGKPASKKAAAGESPSHSGGGVKCEPDCRMCSGEYCKIHLNKPCDCDCLDRHGIFQDQKQQKPGGAS